MEPGALGLPRGRRGPRDAKRQGRPCGRPAGRWEASTVRPLPAGAPFRRMTEPPGRRGWDTTPATGVTVSGPLWTCSAGGTSSEGAVLQLTDTDIMVEGVAANSPTGVRLCILMAGPALVAAAVFALAPLRRRRSRLRPSQAGRVVLDAGDRGESVVLRRARRTLTSAPSRSERSGRDDEPPAGILGRCQTFSRAASPSRTMPRCRSKRWSPWS